MRRRGATILEVIVAASILMVGMVGVVQLVLAGAMSERRGEMALASSLMLNEALTQARATPFAELTVGTHDAGVLYDSFGREYVQEITVTDISDGGYPTYDVAVRMTFNDRLMPGVVTQRVSEIHSVLTTTPDGGL